MNKNLLKKRTLNTLALSSLLAFTSPTWALDWFGGDAAPPSLTLAPAEIAIELPAPIHRDLELLLSGTGGGKSLAELESRAVRKFSTLLRKELDTELRKHFEGEGVPLVQEGGLLTLRNFLDIAVSRQLHEMETTADYELERGVLTLSGTFHYRLENNSGEALRERRLDIAELQVQEKYLVKAPLGGGEAENSSDQATEQALTKLVGLLLERVEDDLEADELRDMTAP
ncbi:hypothetical protein [Microbulbifer rhizosphaerae]|uniref:Curli production assembly/transport component CsgG n=1 Tax=Microbulbifer rhizosphaerae TaxID=1562603 RepID=A0A7W4Z9F1_9GAMM|nr:hypothetical protein [Microbulbifer rhizosphaerae]MBB3061617.1 hypothetical protein [Microbulbifer rhizosphaerae]